MITAVYDDVAVINKSSFKAQRVGRKREKKKIRRLSETFPLMLSYRLVQRISMSSVLFTTQQPAVSKKMSTSSQASSSHASMYLPPPGGRSITPPAKKVRWYKMMMMRRRVRGVEWRKKRQARAWGVVENVICSPPFFPMQSIPWNKPSTRRPWREQLDCRFSSFSPASRRCSSHHPQGHRH